MLRVFGRIGSGRSPLVQVSLIHLWNDAFFAMLFPILPLIATEFSLSYTQSGLLKTLFSGSAVVSQLPVGYLAVWSGEFIPLVVGNLWVAGGIAFMGLAPSYIWLLVASVFAGLGGGAQHPLGSSLISKLYENRGRATAIGKLNFAGDLGKLIGPALVGVLAATAGWRSVLFAVGALGGGMTVVVLFLRRSTVLPLPASEGASNYSDEAVSPNIRVFAGLTVIGMLDAASRGASLTFLPFVLANRGLEEAALGTLFTVIFAGGAVGKIACGWLGDKVGAFTLIWITELMVALLLLLFFPTPHTMYYPLAFSFGFALNGTSSVLYASVASLVPSRGRAKGYAYFFTFTLGASALAPIVFGLVADVWGLFAAMVAISVATALILPIAISLRQHLA